MVLQNIITLVVAIFASTGFWTLINNIYQDRKAKNSVEREMLLGLGHDKLHFLCRSYLKKGWITPDEYDNLRYIYDPYVNMGGNGTGKHLMEQVNKLPIMEEEGEPNE